MYEFMSDQVLGINGLINLSNIVFLVAFSVRDFLKLRILAIVGEGLTLPYYYFQGEPLWPPIVWGAAFMLVNAVRVIAIALERRPVDLSDREERLPVRTKPRGGGSGMTQEAKIGQQRPGGAPLSVLVLRPRNGRP
jgi:hypothetical protein